MDRMKVTSIVTKRLVLILIICYGASATCSKKAIVDKQTKTATFNPLPGHDIKTNLSLKYNSKGLQPLFDLASSFMNTVQPKNFGEVFKDKAVDKLIKDWKKVVTEYEIPILVAVGIGLLFFLFMPITGLCFCCCRCCGKCGGDMKQSEKKAAQHCNVACMVFFLFVFIVLMLCGVLFMFVTNDRLHDASKNVVKTYDEAISEAEKMADIVIKDIDQLTTNQVSCITNLVTENIDNTAIKEEIGKPLRTNVQNNVSAVLAHATATSQKIDKIVGTMNDVVAKKNDFTINVKQLKSELNAVQTKLNGIVQTCKKNTNLTDICNTLQSIKLDATMDFNSIPNITQYKNEMESVQNLNLANNIKKANDTVENIPDTAVNKSKSAIEGIRKLLDDTEKTLQHSGKNITDEIQKQVDKVKEKTTSKIHDDIKKGGYNKYERLRWKVYVALSAIMAFIVFILFCGLSCGSCGYNKDYMPTERSTTSNCGGNFLMAGVGLMFFFSFILMIFCVVWFAVGMHTHIFCREMKNADLIDNMFLNNVQNISANEILRNCRKNTALYRATPYIEANFNISQRIDINIMKDVDEKINNINFNLRSEKILTKNAKDALTDLIDSNVSKINFDKFLSILNDSITSRNLTEIITNLSSIATGLEKSSAEMAADIHTIAKNTTTIKDTTVVSLKENIEEFTKVVKKLQGEISSIKDNSKDLLDKLISSEYYVQNETPAFIKNRIKEFASELIGYVDQGITHIKKQLKDNAARCKPIANIYDGLVNTFLCENVVQNANGFWLALGWCLLFFIPSIILSVKLAKYFRKMDYSAGMDTIVVDHPPYNDKLPPHSNKPPYSTPGYSIEMRPPPPYASTQHNNPGYQHV